MNFKTVALLLLLSTPMLAQATSDVSLEVASHWGGAVHAADIHGDLAYIANGRVLRILDISDETNPVSIGWVELGLAGVQDVKVRDGYAYVASSGDHWFSVVDVSKPTNPVLVQTHLPPNAGSGGAVASNVVLYGNYAYLSPRRIHQGAPRIYDISNPEAIGYVGQLAQGSYKASLVIMGDKLYVGDDSHDSNPMLSIYDLAANPANPPRIATIGSNSWQVFTLTGADNHLYVLAKLGTDNNDPRALITVDISDPTNPTFTDLQASEGFLDSLYIRLGSAMRIQTAGDRLYLGRNLDHIWDARWGSSPHGLHIFDIGADPAKPEFLSTTRASHGLVEAVLSAGENRAYLWDSAEGFVIMDTTDPALPVPLGTYHSPSMLRNMLKEGDLLYISDHYGGFSILDVSKPAAPLLMGNYLAKRHDTAGIHAWGIDKVGDLVYLAAGNAGLLIVDVSDPAQPHTVGALRISNMAFPSSPWCGARFSGLRVHENTAYVGYLANFCGSAGGYFLSIDVTDPTTPVALDVEFAGSASSERLPKSVAVYQEAVFLSGDLRIFGIADPANLVWLFGGSSINNAYGQDLAIYQSLRLVVTAPDSSPFSGGIFIHEVSNPSSPQLLASIAGGDPISGCGNLPNAAHSLAAQNERAYVYAFSSILIFDISNPHQPECVYRMNGFPAAGGPSSGDSRMLVDEPDLYVVPSPNGPGADTNALGLTIFNIHGLEPGASGPTRQAPNNN